MRPIQVIRNRLVDQGDEAELSEDLKAELHRQLADDDAAPEDVVAWEEVKAEALARAGR